MCLKCFMFYMHLVPVLLESMIMKSWNKTHAVTGNVPIPVPARSKAVRLLGLRVRIPPEEWMSSLVSLVR